MVKKRKTTTKAKRGRSEPLPDAWDHDEANPVTPTQDFVPAFSGDEVVWVAPQDDPDAPASEEWVVRRAPVKVWRIEGGFDVKPLIVEKANGVVFGMGIKYANGVVAHQGADGFQFAFPDEAAWFAYVVSTLKAAQPQQPELVATEH